MSTFTIAIGIPAAHGAVIIDSFSSPSGSSGAGVLPDLFVGTQPNPQWRTSNQTSVANAIGGSREMYLVRSDGTGGTNIIVSQPGGQGNLGFSSDTQTTGKAWVTYDGNANAAGTNPNGTINYTGLNSQNLVNGGTFGAPGSQFNTAFMGLLAADLGAVLRIEVYTTATQWSSFDYVFGGSGGAQAYQPFQVYFSQFTPQAGGGANFSNVGAIRLVVNALDTQAADINLQFLSADVGVPEPATVVMVGSALVACAVLNRRRTRRS